MHHVDMQLNSFKFSWLPMLLRCHSSRLPVFQSAFDVSIWDANLRIKDMRAHLCSACCGSDDLIWWCETIFLWSMHEFWQSLSLKHAAFSAMPNRHLSLECCGVAEASCKSQILTAQAVAADMGQQRAAQTGVAKWASIHVGNSERDAHRTMKKQKTKLDIKIESIRCNGVMIPWISPESWLPWIVKKGLWPMLAGCQLHDYAGARNNWSKFWEMYRTVNPDFELFGLEDIDLSRTAAFLVHGDEGRTLKKGGIMVTSLQSCLGCGFDEKRVCGQKDDSSKLRVNFAGHSFTTRFVVSTIPRTSYETDADVFSAATDHVAKSLDKCLKQGYVDQSRGGEKFRIAISGIKGDAPFLSKVGNFYRSYNTTAKRGEQRGAPKGVCPYCLAGTDLFPAEEIATCTPKWRTTVGVKPPWVSVPAFVRRLAHNPSDPASFFKSDIWHVVHLGFGRSWVASVLQLVLPFLPQRNLDEKWSFLTDEYLAWCKNNSKQAHISKITAYLMSYGEASGAMGNWHKGALTSNFFRWLVEFLGKVPPDDNGWVKMCREATYRMNSMFGVLYRAGAFLSRNEASFVSSQGWNFWEPTQRWPLTCSMRDGNGCSLCTRSFTSSTMWSWR